MSLECPRDQPVQITILYEHSTMVGVSMYNLVGEEALNSHGILLLSVTPSPGCAFSSSISI